MTTEPLSRFWPALENLPGPAAVAGHWRQLLGADYDLVARQLTPRPGLARSIPRYDGVGREYRVVWHADCVVGVGRSSELPIPLTDSELVVYQLNAPHLARSVAAALNVDEDFGPVENLPGTFRVGHYRPLAGFDLPIYLTLQLEEPDFRAAVASLVARSPGEFLLLAPTARHSGALSRQLLDCRNAVFLSLAEAIRLGSNDRWEASEAARKVLNGFRLRLLPADPRPSAFFPTPATAQWSDVKIAFVDGDRVRVTVGPVAETLHYAQMGMADGRNAKCTKQWELLRTFARNRGVLTWRSSGADGRNRKRCQELANVLRQFFRIPADPIVLINNRKAWQTVFAIEPD